MFCCEIKIDINGPPQNKDSRLRLQVRSMQVVLNFRFHGYVPPLDGVLIYLNFFVFFVFLIIYPLHNMNTN